MKRPLRNDSAVCLIFPFCLMIPICLTSTLEAEETYSIRYELQAGEQLRYEVTHVAKTKTRIGGEESTSNVHTVSTRHWDVTGREGGNMVFDHVLDTVSMTQKNGDEDEIRWSSTDEVDPPAIFTRVADQIGEPITTLTINPRGQEVAREDFGATKASLGMGSLSLPLPDAPIAIGASWSVPREFQARTEEGEVKIIKIRELYTLEKVQTGVATISIRSEPLTVIDQASIEAQVVQQLSNGKIRFDIDNGRMLSKQLDWDATVVGFQGANSLMEYRARLTEEAIDEVPHTARARD